MDLTRENVNVFYIYLNNEMKTDVYADGSVASEEENHP